MSPRTTLLAAGYSLTNLGRRPLMPLGMIRSRVQCHACTIKKSTTAISIAAVISTLLACEPPGSGRDAEAKRNLSACEALWRKASTDNSGRLAPSEAQPYTTDFSAIDTNGDGLISQAEFVVGCQTRVINSSQLAPLRWPRDGLCAPSASPAASVSASEKSQDLGPMQIFAGFPPRLDTHAYQRCELATRSAIKTWAVDYMKRVGGVSASWDSIDELHGLLWSAEGMKNTEYNHARGMVMNTADYLRFVRDEFRTHDNGQFTDEERNMWRAHLYELGASPFFLLALKDKQRFGYIVDDMHGQMHDYLKSCPAVNCAMLALHPTYQN